MLLPPCIHNCGADCGPGGKAASQAGRVRAGGQRPLQRIYITHYETGEDRLWPQPTPSYKTIDVPAGA